MYLTLTLERARKCVFHSNESSTNTNSNQLRQQNVEEKTDLKAQTSATTVRIRTKWENIANLRSLKMVCKYCIAYHNYIFAIDFASYCWFVSTTLLLLV